jgi:hypothetical protein
MALVASKDLCRYSHSMFFDVELIAIWEMFYVVHALVSLMAL